MSPRWTARLAAAVMVVVAVGFAPMRAYISGDVFNPPSPRSGGVPEPVTYVMIDGELIPEPIPNAVELDCSRMFVNCGPLVEPTATAVSIFAALLLFMASFFLPRRRRITKTFQTPA